MPPRALLTGVTGQDGSYLAEFLLQKGYEVHCIIRPERVGNLALLPDYLAELLSNVILHGGDLRDTDALKAVYRKVMPDETYHLGGPTRVDSNVTGNSNVFKAIFDSTRVLLDSLDENPSGRLLFAGTSEIFGNPRETPQSELSPRNPRSLYGVAKLAATDLIERRRAQRGIFACTGILYNHESPRREPFFLSRKVTRGLARVALGLQPNVSLGNLGAMRDWGYAPDYVEAMWRILQHDRAGDYVIATGKAHTVQQLVDVACEVLNLDSKRCIQPDPRYFRPLEPITLCGNANLIQRELGWAARKSFGDMIREMVLHDLQVERARGGT